MFSVIKLILTGMIEGLFPRFSPQDLVLRFIYRMSFSYYSEEGNDINYFKVFDVVIHRPSNYTKVLVKEVGKDDRYRLLSDHDSGWREDGMKWIFQTFSDAWDYFDKHGVKREDISTFCSFALSGEPCFYQANLSIDYEERVAKVDFIKKLELKGGCLS